MRVLTSDAVQDPTKVEARVRREVALRKQKHEVMNADRKLTDEQRREKAEVKKVEEEKKGIYGAVYKCVSIIYDCGSTLTHVSLQDQDSQRPIPSIQSSEER